MRETIQTQLQGLEDEHSFVQLATVTMALRTSGWRLRISTMTDNPAAAWDSDNYDRLSVGEAMQVLEARLFAMQRTVAPVEISDDGSS